MRTRMMILTLTLALAASGLWLASRPRAQAQEPAQLSAQELQEDIELLEVLAHARFAADELQALADAASQANEKRSAIVAARQAPARLAALEALREALLEGKSGEALWPLHEQLEPHNEPLWQAEDAMHEAIEQAITELLTVIPEPALEGLLEALRGDPARWLEELCHEARHIPPAEYEEWLGDVSHGAAAELSGDEREAGPELITEVATLIGSTRNMTDAEVDAADEQIHTQAQALATSVRPALSDDERAEQTRAMLMDLLEHPRLEAVLNAQLARQ